MINATYTFSPDAGGSISVTNKATEADVKEAVKTVLATRKTTAMNNLANIESAEAAMG